MITKDPRLLYGSLGNFITNYIPIVAIFNLDLSHV